MSTKEHILSPIESILINKWMPKGYKLELAKNVTKTTISQSSQIKKVHNPPQNPLNAKWLSIIKEILTWPQTSNYYISKVPNEPCLEQIEKKIYLNRYKSIFDFAVEMKKWFWFYCEKNETNKEVHKELYAIGTKVMELIKEVDKSFTMVLILAEVTPMTQQQKLCWCENIRRLTLDKLKGWVTWLADNPNQYKNAKFFEFDIEKLSHIKCRAIESYVRGCLLDYKEVKDMTNNNNANTSNDWSGKGNDNQNNSMNNSIKDLRNNTENPNQKELSVESDSDDSSNISK